MQIDVHPLTNNPTAAWQQMLKEKSQRIIKISMKPPKNQIPIDKVRVVCMSDTHSLQNSLKFDIPEGDIFIHAGDFSRCGRSEEIQEFNDFLGTLTHKHKLVIAGNHELSFDSTFTHPFQSKTGARSKHSGSSILDDIPSLGNTKENLHEAVQAQNVRTLLSNCTYLEDSAVEIYGIKFYGTPWQPEFCRWAFNLPRGTACLEKWNLIPDDTDVLISHTPAVGHGDMCCSGVRAGCVELLSTLQQRVCPKYHIFGHIHEGYGITSDGKIIFINASTCDINYLPNNPPIVFDISLREGITKN